jgi:hypothetical protein
MWCCPPWRAWTTPHRYSMDGWVGSRIEQVRSEWIAGWV